MKNNLTWLIAILMSVNLIAQDYAVSSIADSLLKNANTVVRFDDKEVVITVDSDIHINRKKAITVFNEEGLNTIHQVFHYYGKIRLRDLKAKIYNANSEVIKELDADELEHRIEFHNEKSGVKSAGYYVDLSSFQHPFTLEINYTYQSRTTAFIPSWTPLSTHKQSVEYSTMRVINYSPSKLNYFARHLSNYPNIETEQTGRLFRVQAQNLNSIPKEVFQPAIVNFTPQVHFSLAHFTLGKMRGKALSWGSLGAWKYYNTPINTWAVGDASIGFITGILETIQDKDYTQEKKVEVIYNFVKDNHHLINRSVENIDWQKNEKVGPTHLEYDACLNTLFYTKNLLHFFGINAYYALVTVNDQPVDLIEDLPSIQGNQMMLYVPFINDEIWLDCATYEWPFNFVSTNKAQRKVMIISEQGGELIFTPSYAPEENLQSTSIQLEVTKEGKLKDAELKRNTEKIAYERRRLLHEKNQLEKNYELEFSEIENLSIENLDVKVSQYEAKIEEKLNFTGEFETKANKEIAFSLSSFGTPFNLPNEFKSRSTPFSIAKGYKYKDEITLKLPAESKLNLPFTEVEKESKFGTYLVQLSQNENTLNINRIFVLKSGDFSKADYVHFFVFIKKIQDYELKEFSVLN